MSSRAWILTKTIKKGAILKVKFTVTWFSGSALHSQRKWREDRNQKVSKLQTGLQNWSWNLNRVLLDEQAFINLRLKHFCTRYFGLHLQGRTVCFKDYSYFGFHKFLVWAVRMETDPPTCRHIQNSSINVLNFATLLKTATKAVTKIPYWDYSTVHISLRKELKMFTSVHKFDL